MDICVVGSGMGGSIVVNELAKIPNFNITVVDCDSIQGSFDPLNSLNTNKDKQLSDEVTVGYGFGGTTNLWHGVLTSLDTEDWKEIDKVCNSNVYNDWLKSSSKLGNYFNGFNINNLYQTGNTRNIKTFLNIDRFDIKNYYVQKFPFRSRNLIKDLVKKNKNVNLLESAVAVSLNINSSQKCNNLIYSKDKKIQSLTADVFIISAGALETPRILLQNSRVNNPDISNLGKGLIDHPHAIVGKITLPKKIFYKSHGGSSSSLLSPYRIGLTINKELRNNKKLNHSIFLRPHLGKDHDQWRKNIKALLQEKFSFSLIRRVLFFKDIFSTVIILLAEKFGFGVYTDQIAVSVQLEQDICNGGEITLSESIDKFGRQVPEIRRHFSNDHLEDIQSIHRIIKKSLIKGSVYNPYTINFSDLSSGAHHSGTCRMGHDSFSDVVDPNLKYFRYDNVFICDASVIPKIGNANLSITIGGFAIRLAEYLIKIYKGK